MPIIDRWKALVVLVLLGSAALARAGVVRWPEESETATVASGPEGGYVARHLDLTETYGEREYLRMARWIDVDDDGQQEIVSRTMNENRMRAIDGRTGETEWLSPMVAPADKRSQVSDMAVGDIDEDGNPDATIVSYSGDVICIDLRDGDIKWHRELDYHINNPRLHYADITEGPGKNLALTVSNDFDWTWPRSRPRINMMKNPSLLVLNGDGSRAWIAEEYDVNNSNGHNTWTGDIDGDGLHEVAPTGDEELHWFDNDGTHMFGLPVSSGGHPDAVCVGDFRDRREGNEVAYLDGIHHLAMADSSGNLITRKNIRSAHLQWLYPIQRGDKKGFLISSAKKDDADAMVCDTNAKPLWRAELGYACMTVDKGFHTAQWDGKPGMEIPLGASSNSQKVSIQVCDPDGTLLYCHQWDGYTSASVLDAKDIDSDGQDELLCGAGTTGGPEGRFSLPEGSHMHMYVIDPPPAGGN